MRKFYSLFFVLLFLVSCRQKEKIPADILPQSKMQAVLWDMICGAEFFNGYIFAKDSIDKLAESSKVYSQVFQVHRITKQEFDKSYGYYREHPLLLKTILDSLANKQLTPTYPVPIRDSSQKNIIMPPDVK